jgi:hypothetical protein
LRRATDHETRCFHRTHISTTIFASLLISSFFCTSSTISLDVSWFTSLNKDSPDYGKHLYCGTVARGATYLNEKDTVADPLGVIEGVKEILDLKFTGIEIKWIQDQIRLIGKNTLFGRGPDIKPSLNKIYLNLWMHKTVDSSSPNLATMLNRIKSMRRIKDDQAVSYFAYLNDFPPSKDPICEEFRKKVFTAIQNLRYFVPNLTLRKNIESAIKHGIKSFADKKGIVSLNVYSVYLHLVIVNYKNIPNELNRLKIKIVLEMLANKYKYSRLTDTDYKDKVRILLGIICYKLETEFPINLREVRDIISKFPSEILYYYDSKRYTRVLKIPVLVNVTEDISWDPPKMGYLLGRINEDKEWLMLCPEVEIIFAKYKMK